MRVITGKFKGKPLFSPITDNIRPTSDKLKETMFNILANYGMPQNANVLDLFSGSGALGIEALSRGALSAVFCDKDAASVSLTKKNLDYVKATAQVFKADYRLALKKLAGQKFDLIFIDPPYADKKETQITDLIKLYDLVEDDGIILIEHARDNKLQLDECYSCLLERACGSCSLSIFQKSTVPATIK